MESLSHIGSLSLCYPTLPIPATTKKDFHHRFSAASATTNSGASTSLPGSKWADRLFTDFQFFPTATTSATDATVTTTLTSLPPSLAPPDRHIPIPLNFYEVLGAETHFLGDGIRRAFEARVSKPPQYGYSQDALIARRQILQAACDTLSNPNSRRDYNLGLSEDFEETTLFEVPFDKAKFSPLFNFKLSLPLMYMDPDAFTLESRLLFKYNDVMW